MSVYKPVNSTFWYTNFTLGGKRVRVSTGTDDKTLAEQYEARLKVDLWQQQRLGVRPTRSWKEAVVAYSREKSHKRTLDQDLDRLLKLTPFLQDVPLDRMTHPVIDKAIRDYEAGFIAANPCKWKTVKPFTPSTRNRYRSVVQTMLNLAVTHWEWLDRAPKLLMEREEKDEAIWLTPAQAEALISYCDGRRAHWRNPVRLALATGLRKGNVFGLRWDWVDTTRRVAIVPGANYKAKRMHAVPLNDVAMDVLREQQRAHPTHVFARLHINETNFANACDKIGAKGATFHSLRHTWAAWHIMSGTPLYDLMRLGGWTSLDMLQDTYGHLSPGHLAESAGRIIGKHLAIPPPPADNEDTPSD